MTVTEESAHAADGLSDHQIGSDAMSTGRREVDRPHVAFAVTGLHGVSGGAERVLVDVANGLFDRGYQVSVLTYQHRNGPSFYPLRYGISHLDGRKRHARRGGGSPLRQLDGAAQRRTSVGVLLWLVQYLPKVLRFRRLLKISKPDVVIGFLPSTFPYLTLAALGTGVKTVASMHNVPTRDLGGDEQRWDQNPVDIWLRRRALRSGDANTVLLPSFAEQLEPAARRLNYVVPNMIHPYSGTFADVSTGDDNVVLAVGRLSPAKDHDTLLRAWAKVEQRHPSWRLKIIGDGPLRPDLESLIATLGLERATLDEPTSEIGLEYLASKFVVMSSTYEGFGLVTAEAMAHGVPVIGFADCEGTNEIVVDDVNGLLVEPGDSRSDSLAAAMEQMIDNESDRVRLASGGPATIEAFEPGPVLDAWERVIDDVMQGVVGR